MWLWGGSLKLYLTNVMESEQALIKLSTGRNTLSVIVIIYMEI
jgi:hypothetical protein